MGLEYAECRRCRKLYLKSGVKNVCPECLQKEDEDFSKVKEYLYDYPHASIDEVADQTEVDNETIIDWVKSGRLETGGVAVSYPCTICGRPIHSGKICAKCEQALGGGAKDFKSDSSSSDADLKFSKGRENVFKK